MSKSKETKVLYHPLIAEDGRTFDKDAALNLLESEKTWPTGWTENQIKGAKNSKDAADDSANSKDSKGGK